MQTYMILNPQQMLLMLVLCVGVLSRPDLHCCAVCTSYTYCLLLTPNQHEQQSDIKFLSIFRYCINERLSSCGFLTDCICATNELASAESALRLRWMHFPSNYYKSCWKAKKVDPPTCLLLPSAAIHSSHHVPASPCSTPLPKM